MPKRKQAPSALMTALRDYKQDLGLTWDRVAAVLGVSRAILFHWLSGARKPSPANLSKINLLVRRLPHLAPARTSTSPGLPPTPALETPNLKCPSDTNGDGNCGKPFCPFCGVHRTTVQKLKAVQRQMLVSVVSANHQDCIVAVEEPPPDSGQQFRASIYLGVPSYSFTADTMAELAPKVEQAVNDLTANTRDRLLLLANLHENLQRLKDLDTGVWSWIA